jgi:hypothetical protein
MREREERKAIADPTATYHDSPLPHDNNEMFFG